MGYTPQPRRYRLIFDDPSMEGLEVLAKSVTLGEFMDITGMDDTAAIGGATLRDDTPVRPSLVAAFADRIVEWNITDQAGKPVTPSHEALIAQELGLVRAMVKAWLEAVSGVSPTSPGTSNGSGTFPEESLPMEPLSPSPQS